MNGKQLHFAKKIATKAIIEVGTFRPPCIYICGATKSNFH